MKRHFLIFFIGLINLPLAQAQDKTVTSLESKILSDLKNGQFHPKSLKSQVQGLTVEQRRAQAFHIGDQFIEFELKGQYPAGVCLPSSVEYVLAPAGPKDHEVLLALDKEQWRRAKALGKAIDGWTKKGKGLRYEIELLWLEEGKIRKEALRDVLGLATEKEQKQFFSNLKFGKYGLSSHHAKGDAARLPKKKGPLQLRLRLYLK